MHFSAKRGTVITVVCPSVTLVDGDHIGWNSWKIISPLVSLGCSLSATVTWWGKHAKIFARIGLGCWKSGFSLWFAFTYLFYF